MPMLDTFKYERSWFVHDEDEFYHDGEEYQSLDGAVDAAKHEATYRDENYSYVVTEVLTRSIKKTKTVVTRSVEIEDF